MKMADFVDGKLCLRSVARKSADFMAEKMFPISAAKNRGVFLAGCVADKKRDTLEVAKKKPGGEPGEFFACYKRNKFIC